MKFEGTLECLCNNPEQLPEKVMSKSKVPGGANGAWADAHLDDVSAGKDERLHHVASNDVPGLKGGKRINQDPI